MPGTVRALGTTQGRAHLLGSPAYLSLSRLVEAHSRLSLLSGRLNEAMNEPKTGRATWREGQRRREGTREQGRKQRRAREAGMRRKRGGGDGRVGITRAYTDRSPCAGPVSFPSPCARHMNAGGREESKDEEGKEQDGGRGGARERRPEASPVGRKGRPCSCRAGGRGRLLTLLHPPGLGLPLPPPAAGSAWEASGACGGLSSLPALSRPLQPPPRRDPHLLCRRGKGLEIRGLAVSAKEKQFS